MKCFSFDSRMQPLGHIPIRVGGTSGGWHLLFGQWADAGEDVLSLDVYRCSHCKRVEFFDLEDELAGRCTSE